MEGIKPPAGLIDSLADIVRRVPGFEQIGILERIMPLRELHGAGIEPDIDQLRSPAHLAAAGTVERYGIDVRLVEVERFLDVLTLPVFPDTPDAFPGAALLAHPDGQRRAPEPVA